MMRDYIVPAAITACIMILVMFLPWILPGSFVEMRIPPDKAITCKVPCEAGTCAFLCYKYPYEPDIILEDLCWRGDPCVQRRDKSIECTPGTCTPESTGQ